VLVERMLQRLKVDLQETQEAIQFFQQLHQPVAVVELWKVEQVDPVVQVVEQEIMTLALQVQVELVTLLP
tara:strand:+ start:52 stop:261 length:210 start_codon:yes stop_codon:yes gene_type:complete